MKLLFSLLLSLSFLSADYVSDLQKDCDNGDPSGCYNLGNMYSDGRGVKQNSFKAVELYKKSCDGGDVRGCRNLGNMYNLRGL